MAANDATTGQADEDEPQITFNIKASNDTKYVLTVPTSMTVSDLKQKLSTTEYANIPPERQRLIYSGRVLKEPDTMGSCKIKDGNTVHLVRGAESERRQMQAGSAPIPGAGQPQSNVPSTIAAGVGASNLLAQATGARNAGFQGLPGMDMFGPDGGMGATSNPEQMLQMLQNPEFASQMRSAMEDPEIRRVLLNNPMIRDNPTMRQALENPQLRQMLMQMIMDPNMIRMQMQMQRAMGGEAGGEFPMPGQTDTTDSAAPATGTTGTTDTTGTLNSTDATNPSQNTTTQGQPPVNPFAALLRGADQPGTDSNTQQQSQQLPSFPSLFGGMPPQTGQTEQTGNQPNPLAAMTQQLMQNPELMQQMMRAMGGGTGEGAGGGGNLFGGLNPEHMQQMMRAMGGGTGEGAGGGGNLFGGLDPFALGGGGDVGQQRPGASSDTRSAEERFPDQLGQLNAMGLGDSGSRARALQMSDGDLQGAVEYLLWLQRN